MNLLSAEKISKSYSEKVLFEDITFGIEEGEKVGLIGVNGTGKSTFLKVLAGIEVPDTGSVVKGNGIRVEYLSQTPYFEQGITVIEQVFKGNSPEMIILRDYEKTLQLVNTHPDNKEYTENLLKLTQKMDNINAWTIESEAKNILTKLGINEYYAKVETLSGGQKKRVAMASALISPVDLLILDEPTNHIDNDTVDWLEKYLNSRKGALLMVTHDRYFLDRVANRIIELDNGKLYSYQANFSKYLEMKLERDEILQSSFKKHQNLLRRELEWIRRGAQARSTKQKARIERFEKLNEVKGPMLNENIDIKVGASRLGRKTIEIEHINKSYDDKLLIKDFSYILKRDDRIGIIGPNGRGKSTLLKIFAGRLKPDSGNVEIGETVKVGFFTQENEGMNEELRVIEYIREEAEYLTTSEGQISASQMLENFLFPPSVQWTPINKLSGGEKRRLYLLRILMGAPNIIFLDEPTNDLDIKTLSILEGYLEDFPGAVVAVSHDRYFLDRVVEKIFSFEGNGIIKTVEGNYSDYSQAILQENTENEDKIKNERLQSNKEQKKDRPLKLSYKEQKEFDEIDSVIEGLEAKIESIENQISDSSSDFNRLQELLKEQEELKNRLSETMDRWVYLNELAEAIENSKKQN